MEFFTEHLKQAQRIISLKERTENATDDQLEELLQEALEERKISAKDTGDKSSTTQYHFLHGLMQHKGLNLLLGDVIGFKNIKREDLSRTVYRIAKLESPRHVSLALLQANDAGTQALDDIKKEQKTMVQGKSFDHYDGGDETFLATSQEISNQQVQEIAEATSCRIALVTNDIQLPAIEDPENLTTEQRREVMKYLTALLAAEEAHEDVKKQTKRGYSNPVRHIHLQAA